MPILRDILAPDAKIWAHPVWGPIGPKDRVRAFGKEQVARRLEREAQYDRDMILSIGVGTVKRSLPKELTGCLLDISTFVPRVMRTEDIIGREQYQRWMVELAENADARWPWGVPVVRAWRIPAHPHADDLLPGLRRERFVYHHPELMTTRLSTNEINRILDLTVEPIEFEVAITDESGLAAQKRASERVRRWASSLAQAVAARCRGSRAGYVALRPGFETNESDLHLLIGKLIQDQKERCALCGGALDLSEAPNRLAQPSADRIDGSIKVYEQKNLQITHLACNLGKNKSSNNDALDFFRSWCGGGMPDETR